MVELTKKCIKCLQDKPFTEYRKHKISKDGLKNDCKVCDSIRAKNYYKTNKKEKQEWMRNYSRTHKKERNTYRSQSHKNNPILRIRKNLGRRIRDLLKNTNEKSNTIGCSGKELKLYLESKFKPGMNWENYGGNDYSKLHWQVDHIKPISKFNLEDIEERKKANHYTNLQPLWWKENLSKSNKYNE